ncbi:MAG: rplI [Candidatus Paceibacter sp.]|jgi:large subunit ribosomal protein L9|nr:rplI [Candidatus Paceibacter sp.]
MKVILLKDVSKVGKKFEVKEVASGFALNMLIPRKLAEAATPSALARFNNIKAREDGEKKVREDLLMKNLKQLDGKTIEIKETANDKGHLFKGVHQDELVAEIKKQIDLDLAPEYIMLEKPIKEVGEHEIEVKVQDKSAKFKVNIIAD